MTDIKYNTTREQTEILFGPPPHKYPNVPGWKKQDTSRRAAHEITPKARTIRENVLAHLKIDLAGLTTDECAGKLGLSVLSVRPRFSELLALGKIMDSGDRRPSSFGKSQIVWVLTL